MFEVKTSTKYPLITVPDLDAPALMRMTLRALSITSMADTRLTEWDFWRTFEEGVEITGRGQMFEAVHIVVAKNSYTGNTPENASHFLLGQGAEGHVGAFLAWLMTAKPLKGFFTTVPPAEQRLIRRKGGHVYLPCAEARHGYGVSDFDARWLGEEWSNRCEYLGFRPVSN
jgi:hypothetical protein